MLTDRQWEVVQLVAKGWGNGPIGQTLAITESTVKKHVSDAMARLGQDNRTALALAVLACPVCKRRPRPVRPRK